MFRRGRRPIGHIWPPLRPWANSPLERNSRRDLVRANRLMEIGDFTNAAILFSQLARKVHDRGRPRQAAHLYLQAARAKRLSGQFEYALDFYQQGLGIFAQAGMWAAFDRAGNRAVEALHQQDQSQVADELANWMQTARQTHPDRKPVEIAPVGESRALPLKCPSCGAAIRTDEVEWIDDQRAVCEYCGSTLAVE